MGRILEMAKRDARRYVNDGGFNQELTITPEGEDPVIVNGLATRHSQGFDDQGLPVISDNVHCSFSELDLNAEEVVTRNLKGELIIKDWKVEFTDSIGSAVYKFSEPQPDNTLGIIKITLTSFE